MGALLSIELNSISIEGYFIQMPPVNDERSARPPTLREERAAVTRRRILYAARLRFFEDGYAATTLGAVAAEAGVAVQTIYAVFGSKAAILAELRALAVDLPQADDEARAAMSEPTAELRLTRFAYSIRNRWELAGDIVKVHQDAVRVDPSLRPGIAAAEARRHGGIAAFVRAIANDLGVAINVERSIGIVNALTLYAVYEELVVVQNWSPDAYEAWLAESLIAGVVRR
jgi:AcrR family transcriptional regulator